MTTLPLSNAFVPISYSTQRKRNYRHCSGFGVSGFGLWEGSHWSGGPGLTFANGYHIVKGRTSALTLNVPITIGAYSKQRAGWFIVDLPLMLDVNLGDLAGDQNTHLGFRFGVGVGACYANIFGNHDDDSIYGYAWGLRYNVGISWRSIMLISTWRSGNDPGTGNMFGVGIIINNF